jgi:hypothetical protein
VKKSTAKRATKKSQYWDTKTFTWFIPAPQGRSRGHREKEFDKILHGILHSGHEVISWQVQPAGGEHGGIYAVFLLGSTSKATMGPMLDMQEQFALSDQPSDADIELIDE